MELDPETLQSYVQNRFGGRFARIGWPAAVQDLVQELAAFGVRGVRDLDALLDDEYLRAAEALAGDRTDVGLVRTAMMWKDIDRYFATAYRGAWQVVEAYSHAVLARRYPESGLEEVCRRYDIELDELAPGSAEMDEDAHRPIEAGHRSRRSPARPPEMLPPRAGAD